ncbi:MAG: hypothetical protein PHP20_07790 [Firmicutes bacterium]|nr:hypothetical protein [Bacillota bacterium]MDD4792951.1 hypothetical protein [Bacillota bacterium]
MWNTRHVSENKPEPRTTMSHGFLLRVGNEDWGVVAQDHHMALLSLVMLIVQIYNRYL